MLALLAMILTACAAEEGSTEERLVPNRPFSDMVSDTVTGTAEGAWSAVQAPFVDINLKQQEIPPLLVELARDPYVPPQPPLCGTIRSELRELEVLLGPDVNSAPKGGAGSPSRRGEYIDEGTKVARDQAVGLVSSHTNILPFRGMVRKLSGAERHAREVERAYQAGRLRRAFLKGLALSQGASCLQ